MKRMTVRLDSPGLAPSTAICQLCDLGLLSSSSVKWEINGSNHKGLFAIQVSSYVCKVFRTVHLVKKYENI